VAAGVTVAAGAATAVSGIATENDPGRDAVRRACAGQGEACALYQKGQDAEMRTNVLLGVTIGAAVATRVIGLFFAEWSSSGGAAARGRGGQATPSSRAGVSLSPFGLVGRF